MKPNAINIVCSSNSQCRAVFCYISHLTGRVRNGPKQEEDHDVVCIGKRAFYTLRSDRMASNTEMYPRIHYADNSHDILRMLREKRRA